MSPPLPGGHAYRGENLGGCPGEAKKTDKWPTPVTDMMDKVYNFTIPVNSMERAKKFYGTIFGWKLSPTGMQYDYHSAVTSDSDEKGMPKSPGSINGALYDRAGGDDAIRLSIEVASMDEALKGVRDCGGVVIHDKMEVPGRGYFAEIMDTEGNTLHLWQNMTAPSA